MPTREGHPHEVSLAPPVLQSNQGLWICRYSGALYASYEDYLRVLGSYRQRTWGCRHTNAANLCFEEALASETRSQQVLDQFPPCFEETVARLVHHATLKQEDLSQRIVTYFKDHFVVGEELFALRDDKEAALRVSACVDTANQYHDSHMLCTGAILPPDPEDAFQIEWLSDYSRAACKRADLIRRQLPLTRNTIKAWLQLGTHTEAVTGVKGISCIWHLNEDLRQRYGLEDEVSGALKERLDRAKERKEQAKRPLKDAMVDGFQEDAMLTDSFFNSPEAEGGTRESSPNYVPGPGSRKARSSLAKANAVSTEIKARQPVGTLKRVVFDALEAAGQDGLSTAELAELVQASGVKTWDAPKSAHSSLNATCTHDLAFKRIGPGKFALRLLLDKEMQVPANAAPAKKHEIKPPSQQAQHIERNNFKCSKCLKAHTAENSPLVLCDGCPRSYHLVCLGLTFEELPEEEWHCPKCQDRKSSTGRRITSNFHKATDIYERFDSDREDGLRGVSDRNLTPADKEKLKEEMRVSREQARIAAKWAALHPIDDIEILEDEEERLASVEAEAQAISEEAERAAKKPNPKNDQRQADRAVRLRKKAEAARKRASELRLVIEGPSVNSLHRDSPTSMLALYDALAIVDFVTIFGASFEAPALSVLDVQQMAKYPLDSPSLAQLSVSLLQCLMREAMSMDGVVKSRAKRWANCLNAFTWPEILRRYLLASRVGLSLPENLRNANENVDPTLLDDNSACILGAKLLANISFFSLSPGLLLRILASLCNDVSDCALLRSEINARIEEMNQLQAEFRIKQMEDKRRLKCEAAKPIVPPSTDANEGPQEEEAAKSEPVVNGKSEPETVKKETNDDEDVPGDSQNAQKAKNEDQSDDEATESEGEVEDKDASAPNADQPQDAVKLENGTEEGSQAKDLETKGTDTDAPNISEPEPEVQTTEPPASEQQHQQDAPEATKEIKEQVHEKKEPLDQTTPNPGGEVQKAAENKENDVLFSNAKLPKGKRKARRKGEVQKKAAEAPIIAAQERQLEEEMREREAALDDALDARAIRAEPLGQDRHYRSYWWFPGEPAAIFVEESDGSGLGVLETADDLLNLLDRLNQNGPRERALYQTLQKRYDSILNSLGQRSLQYDINTTPSQNPDDGSQNKEAKSTEQAISASVRQVEVFLNQFERISTSPMTKSIDEWRERIKGVTDTCGLVTLALELEADINDLGTGLPSGGDDASLAGYSKRKKSTGQSLQPGSQFPSRPSDTENLRGNDSFASLPERPAQKDLAQSDELSQAHPRELQRSEANTVEALPNGHIHPQLQDQEKREGQELVYQPLKSNLLGKASKELHVRAERSPDEVGGSSADTPTTVDDSEEGNKSSNPNVQARGAFAEALLEERPWVPLPPAEFVEQLFKNEGFHPPGEAILPPDELDASDTEASKNKRGGMVWRSARERRVWLKDAKFALHCQQASRSAYIVAALIDRSQQLLRSLERANKRAERAAELDGFDANDPRISDDDDEKTEDEAPAVKKENTPAPKSEPSELERAVRNQNSLKQQDSKEMPPRKTARRAKRPSEGKTNGRTSQTPQPTKRPKTAPKGKATQEKEEAAKLIEDVMAIANGGVAPPAATWIPTEQGRWSANCQVCGEPGDLLCCDAPDCTVAQHIACAGLDEPPANDMWFCEQHRHKPSLKRSRSATQKKDSSVPLPSKKNGAKVAKEALTQQNGTEQGKKPAAKRRRT